MFDYLEFFGLACIPAFMILDLVHRKRRYRAPKHWRLYATAVSIAVVGVSIAVAAFWGSTFAGMSLLDSSVLGTAGGAVAGVLTTQFVQYGYHRLAHEWAPLWRLGHQVHHSAESLDAFGANYLHPIDAAFFASWSSLVFFPLLGLTPEAGIVAAAFLGFNAVFQHANIATPHWLGYIIQRPESHARHHARGRHRMNYADLPVIDMLFGTFENPHDVTEVEQGFHDGGSRRFFDMLAFRDVSGPTFGPKAEPQTQA